MKKSIIAVLGLVLAVGLAAPSSSLRILSPSSEAGSATPAPPTASALNSKKP